MVKIDDSDWQQQYLPVVAERIGMKTVIIYGPAGCGKTFHSLRLASYFDVSRVVDGWARTERL